MSDETRKDGEPKGFRLKPLSGPDVPDEVECEGAPGIAGEPEGSKSTPIDDAHVMSDAEVVEVKSLRESERRRTETRTSRNSVLKLLGLVVVIVAVVIAVVGLHDSGATTGTTTSPNPKPAQPVKQTPGKKHKQPLPQVVPLPARKGHKGAAKTSSQASPNGGVPGGPNTTINGVGNAVAGHSDKVVAKAQKILEAKQYPHSYLKDPKRLKNYLEEKLSYPVVLDVVTDKTGVLGLDVELPLGKVLLTHLTPGKLAPQITWVVVSKPDLTG